MSKFTSRERLLAGSVLTGLVWGALTVAAAAQVPDFGAKDSVGWIGMGGEFLPLPGPGPKPLTFDPKYPYVPNNTGAQPTFRIADLTNPNLKLLPYKGGTYESRRDFDPDAVRFTTAAE